MYHDGSAERQRRKILRSGGGRSAMGFVCRRPAGIDGSFGDRQVHGAGVLYRRSVHLENVAEGARACHRGRARDTEWFSTRSAEPFLSEQHEELGAGAM